MRMDKGTTKYYIHLYSPKWWSKEEKKIHTYKNIQQTETEAEIKNYYSFNIH